MSLSSKLTYNFLRSTSLRGFRSYTPSYLSTRYINNPRYIRYFSDLPTSPKPTEQQIYDEADENPLGTGAILRGPFGTLENPVVVPSILESRIVGCLGHPDDPHDLTWHVVSEKKSVVCALCAQVFLFNRVELRSPKINWDEMVEQLRFDDGPPADLNHLKSILQERGLLIEEGEDNYNSDFFIAALVAKGYDEHAQFVYLCLLDNDAETLKEYIETHELYEKVQEYFDKRELVLDANVEVDHHDHHDHDHHDHDHHDHDHHDHDHHEDKKH